MTVIKIVLTDDSLVSTWMIDIVIASRDSILQVLEDSLHLYLTIVHCDLLFIAELLLHHLM